MLSEQKKKQINKQINKRKVYRLFRTKSHYVPYTYIEYNDF